MRLPKHILGLIVFVAVLTSTVFIYDYFTWPPWKVRRAKSPAAASAPAADAQPAVNYDVRLVSLDFINGKSYTTLALKREAGQPAPETIRVETRFYVPGREGVQGWPIRAEIRHPFDAGDQVEVTAAGTCDWCDSPDAPEAGYFADVYVSARYAGRTYLPTEPSRPPVEAAVPVVVQAERERRR